MKAILSFVLAVAGMSVSVLPLIEFKMLGVALAVAGLLTALHKGRAS